MMSETSTLPPAEDPRWQNVVMGKTSIQWQALALRIMMTRLTTSTKTDPSPDNIKRCVAELRGFFEKNAKLAQADLNSILG